MRDDNGQGHDKEGRFNGDNDIRNSNKLKTSEPSNDIAMQKLDMYGDEKKGDTKVNSNSQKDNLWGKEHKGIKGVDAIDMLLKEKNGHVKGAFHRPEVGDIDLIWGNDSAGLQHIIKRRAEQGLDGITLIKKLPIIFEKGRFVEGDFGKIGIEFDGIRVAISPAFFSKKVNWIVSAFNMYK